MPVIGQGEYPEPVSGPGGRVIIGWAMRHPGVQNDLPENADDDPAVLREKMSRLLDQARAAVTDPFLIIERREQHYMQCKHDEAGWIVEKREGDEEHHFRALARRPDEVDSHDSPVMKRIFDTRRQRGWYLVQDDVDEVMSSYLLAEPEPEWLEWERFEV